MNFAKKLPSLVPEFLVKDLTRSLAFYRDVLGFKLEFERAESNFAMVSLGEAWIMLEQTEGFSKASPNQFIEERRWIAGDLEYPFGRGVNFQIQVLDIEALYKKVISNNYPINFPLEERSYRVDDQLGPEVLITAEFVPAKFVTAKFVTAKFITVKQFLIMDPDGYLLRMQEEVGRDPLISS